jgi:Glyoxalase-like domain
MGRPKLDHIVILLLQSETAEDLVKHADKFKKWFNVLPGGFHTGGRSQNVLISLEDGVYLELIAFTSPPSKDQRWGQFKPTRIVDMAFLGHPETGKEAYSEGIPGGRGECKWIVTAPKNEWGVGRLPFWCEDIDNPRDLRVPKPTSQPSGVTAIKKMTILVDSPRQQQNLQEMYRKIIGTDELKIGTPNGGEVSIEIKAAETSEEQNHVYRHGRGIYKVEFDVPNVVLSNDIL